VEIVSFSGGAHHGLVVEAPAAIAARLADMSFTVTAAGQLFDLDEQCRIREVRVITRPGEARPEPVPAPVVPTPVEVEPVPVEPVAFDLTRTAPTPEPRRPTVALPQFRAPR
jgi:hypothetical protein